VRVLKKVLLGLFGLILLCILALMLTGNQHVLYGLSKTYLIGKSQPDIDDMAYFDVREIKAGPAESWPAHSLLGKKELNPDDLSFLKSMETSAFLVFHRDSLLAEYYGEGCDRTTRTNSFSMAKSFTGMLIGVAIEEGYIKSVDQKVSDFIPEFSQGKDAELTIRHLLQMSSGIPFGESYSSPFGYMARAYYGKNLLEETMKYSVKNDPGTLWMYEGGNTVLLSVVLQKATGKNLSRYFEEKIWSCIGAENSAFWNLDKKDGMEKAYSAVYATASDYARIGSLYMNNGVWDSDTLVPSHFVKESLEATMVPDSTGEKCSWYGFHWWLGQYKGHDIFSCRGLRGQYIVVVPDVELMFVRTGHKQDKERIEHMPTDLFRYLDITWALADL
jgi:CubicO group peptidase (beta-lactamase class C family)